MAVEEYNTRENLAVSDEMQKKMVYGIKAELSNLEGTALTFYESKQDGIHFKDTIIKDYLGKLSENMKGKGSKGSWNYLTDKDHPERFSTCIIAMQIALESLGFQIGKIDGVLGKKRSNTRAGILRFQNQFDLTQDGLPGEQTIAKLCEALENPSSYQADPEKKPAGVKASASSGSATTSEVKEVSSTQYDEIVTLDNLKYKSKTIKSLNEIPGSSKGYKWEGPSNYDSSKEETYPTIYKFKFEDKEYIFYSNGIYKGPDKSGYTEDFVKEVNKKTEEASKDKESKGGNENKVENESTKPFNEDVYYNLYKRVEKICQKVNAWNMHVSCSNTTVKNPKICVTFGLTNSKDINIRNYVDDEGNFKEAELEKYLVEQRDNSLKEKNDKDEDNKAVEIFKQKIENVKYSFKDLYSREPNTYEAVFLSKFQNEKIEFDVESVDSENFTIQFDVRGRNKSVDRSTFTIKKDELKNDAGNYDTIKFQDIVKKRISEIVDENFKY